jgi:RimJ/RimL family protein N-acetyltransferase
MQRIRGMSMDGVGESKFQWALRRSREVLRFEGPKGLALKMLGRIGYRRVTLLEMELAGRRLSSTGVPIEIRRLGPADVDAYLRARPNESGGDVQARLERGDMCYVTWTDGRVSSCTWYRIGHAHMPEVGCSLPLPQDELYGYDSWTAPELRGKNIAGARAALVFGRLNEAGFRSICAFVLPENRSSLRAATKLGYQPVGHIDCLRLGRLCVQVARRDGKPRLWSVRVREPREALPELPLLATSPNGASAAGPARENRSRIGA